MNQIDRLSTALRNAEAVVIGAGSGLSASAGFTYSGERFERYFPDFKEKYGITDMYSGGFYPFESLEEYWAWWSRHIYFNRYVNAPKSVYEDLLLLMRNKDYFVITTNVDHCFQKAGFDKHRLFYTQGDYGLFQCSVPCCRETFDNETTVIEMLKAQGYSVQADGTVLLPEKGSLKMSVPSELIPYCPHCGKPMTVSLRCDETFVEDEGWHCAAERYSEFLRRHKNFKTLFLDLGTGMNTPTIVKYSFWRMAHDRKDAAYACINYGEAYAPDEIRKKSICINGDIGAILSQL